VTAGLWGRVVTAGLRARLIAVGLWAWHPGADCGRAAVRTHTRAFSWWLCPGMGESLFRLFA